MASLKLFVGGYSVTSSDGLEVFYCEEHVQPQHKKNDKKVRMNRGQCPECFFVDQNSVPIYSANSVNANS